MKKDEVKIGGFYTAKVSDRLVPVRIDSTHSRGGWNATNTATSKRLHIKSAQRLRGEARKVRKAETKEAAESVIATDAPAKVEQAGTKKPKAKKADREQKPKRLSALDAAAQVLAKAGKPMRAQELIEAMCETGLWKSPAGKTPHATLYAAMMREARDKGTASRFRKVDRGQFGFNKAGA